MRYMPWEGLSRRESGERRKILVVGTGEVFTEEIMSYAIHLAERLHFDLVALRVLAEHWEEAPARRTLRMCESFRRKAAERGIGFEHVVKSGDVGSAVEELEREARRIAFVITGAEVNREAMAREVAVPVFSIATPSGDLNGGCDMAGEQSRGKRKPVRQVVGYGIFTVALYAAVFMNADTVMQFFTRGGWYATLPVATAFAFSFAHGAFASNLWSLLGIEAARKDVLRQTERKVLQKRKQATKRPRVYAYVNPYHRIDR